jgi:molecular chaperone HtpG
MADKSTRKFKAETRRVLDLVINSLYSNSDIFLRELVSNASDAVDRLRYLALDEPSLTGENYSPEIVISADRDKRTLSIIDNGVGMDRDELIANLGTVASSGTLRFLEQAASTAAKPELIGQFGVGFYSAFMVARSVTVKTMKAGTGQGWVWESAGEESYTIEEGSGIQPGTAVTLHMKDDCAQYLDDWKIESLVKHYSDFVSNPVFLISAGEDGSQQKKQINTGTPVWLRNPSDVEQEEYDSFYSHLTHSHEKPLDRFWYHGEGITEFYALVFIPATRGMDLMIPDRRPGLALYARKVMIMERAEKLLPQYLHFLRGIVESPDISLNISREMLQEDRVFRTVSKALTRKLLDHFTEMLENRRNDYLSFYSQYGDFLKEGVYSDYERRDDIIPLLLFHTTGTDGMKSLPEVVEGKSQDGVLHYLAGAGLAELRRSPHLESAGGEEVLLLPGPVDLLAVEAIREYKGRKLVNLASDEVETELSPEDRETREKAEKDYSGLMESLRSILGDRVSGVRFSPRLTESPCLLVSSRDDPGEMMRMMMRAMNQDSPEPKMVLEINPSHPVVSELERARASKDDSYPEMVSMFLELARVLSGGKPEDPAVFGKYVARLMSG